MRDSVQLQTVLAMYDTETDRDHVTPRHQGLKTMVRRHVDQTIMTSNFRVRNERRIETGVSVKSHEGRKVIVERQVGECCSLKTNG